MKKEHRMILNDMCDFFRKYNDYEDTDYAQDIYDNRWLPNLEILVATKNTEILEHLMDFFDEEFDCEVGESCEHLKSKIGANFGLYQIIEAFYKKFDAFLQRITPRCVPR